MKLANIKNLTLRRITMVVIFVPFVILLATLGALIGISEVFEGFWSDTRFTWSSRW